VWQSDLTCHGVHGKWSGFAARHSLSAAHGRFGGSNVAVSKVLILRREEWKKTTKKRLFPQIF